MAEAIITLTVSEHVEDFGVKEYERKYIGSKFRNYGTIRTHDGLGGAGTKETHLLAGTAGATGSG